ncbi:MAG: GSU2403 family nucleotidyltransferase fold protein [Pseudomonadota bacterium]
MIERENARGVRFYVHQFYDAAGKQRERYLAGPVGGAEADTRAKELRGRIGELKALVPTFRMLGREGFNLVDPRAYGTIAALHNGGVFEAGGMLIGSHAYGVLLNRLGIRVTAYTTDDVDIARREQLAFKKLPDRDLLATLKESGIDFVEVPVLDRKRPATSFKQPGKGGFHVDLLVPSKNETFPVVSVPELRAHATGLPYLAYLLAESQTGMVIAREGCCAVRLPLPERFAIHKLVVSRLRTGRNTKAQKDIDQAIVLLAFLATTHSGAIESAVTVLPKGAVKHLRAALGSLRPPLAELVPRAWEELTAHLR